jgi:hypothetical protein
MAFRKRRQFAELFNRNQKDLAVANPPQENHVMIRSFSSRRLRKGLPNRSLHGKAV